MKRSILATGAVLGLVLASMLSTSASAEETWTRPLDCGVNRTCHISTNSTNAYIAHYAGSTLIGVWGSGGSHSSAKAGLSGSVTAKVNTDGHLNSQSASCTCGSGPCV